MADGRTSRPIPSRIMSEVDEVDGFNFVSFEKGDEVDCFVKYHRKRAIKRPASSAFAMPDPESRQRKRNRKGDKRVIAEKLDGFTFVSAFTLNDFDDYEKNEVKTGCGRRHPPVKRKSTSNTESTTSKKKARKPSHSIPKHSETSEERTNQILSEFPVENETASNMSKKKNVSPLTKSALVRLRKINVDTLSQNKQVKNTHKPSGKNSKKNISTTKARKSMNVIIPDMEIDKAMLSEGSSNDQSYSNTIIVSDSEDNLELDVCGVDENSSSSQFILNNMNFTEEKRLAQDANLKRGEKGRTRKPCRTCCDKPCRIVGAKRTKSHCNAFPSFNVSFTTTCKLHPPGEIVIHDSSQTKGSIDVCIQATASDIKMHLDFAKRFPYRAITVGSCQPSPYEDLNVPTISVVGTTIRCSENHRIVEQKRREELHGLYCKLAETIDTSKIRASKQWILENACKEIKSLEAKDTVLLAQLNLEKKENNRIRKRWEELSGKPYVSPKKKENTDGKESSKSRFLQLYEKYREDEKQMKDKVKFKSELKEEECELDDTGEVSENDSADCKPELLTSIIATKDVLKPENVVKSSQAESNEKDTLPTTASFTPHSLKSTTAINESNDIQLVSTDQLAPSAKHTSRLIVHPIQRKVSSPKSPCIRVIPRIDLTNQPETPTSNLSERNATSMTPAGNLTTQVETSSPFRSPPPIQSSTHLSTTHLETTPVSGPIDQYAVTLTPSQPQMSKPSAEVTEKSEFVLVSTGVRGHTTVYRIPKTAEGLTMLSRLAMMKKLNPRITGELPCLNQANQSTNLTSVNTRPAPKPVTPTQWSAVASIQNSPSSITATSLPVKQPIATPHNKTTSDVTKQLIFLDVTSKSKPNTNAFSVMPTSSSINVTLNKVGSITANKVFNKRHEHSKVQSNPPKVSDGLTSPRIVPSTIPPTSVPSPSIPRPPLCPILPRCVPCTNVPSSVPCRSGSTCMPPATVHIYAVPPQVSLDAPPVCQTIPQISDSLFDETCENDQENMDEPELCVISNVFSLTDPAASATLNDIGKTTQVNGTIAMNPDIQSATVLGSDNGEGKISNSYCGEQINHVGKMAANVDPNTSVEDWEVEVIDSSKNYGYS